MNNKVIIILLVFVILVVGLGAGNYFGLQIPDYLRLDRGLYNILSPVIDFCSRIIDNVSSYVYVLFNVNDIIAENRQLHRDIGRLEFQIHQMQASFRQNQRLTQLENFLDAYKDFMDYQVEGAMVIGYAPTNHEDVIIINRGANHGLEENMPVIGYNGVLVGHITAVGARTAQVLPVYNTRFAVGGIVQRSRTLGLVRGLPGESKLNVMDNIDPEADIEDGDYILTSGLSENYPKYLPIGRVTGVEEDNYGLSQKAEIELYCSQYTLEEVLVITDF